MAVYDLEEQEKLDDLKAWWNQWGNLVAGVAVAVALGVFAVQGWRWWQGRPGGAGVGPVQRRRAPRRKRTTSPKAKEAVAQLEEKFGGTGYAPRAALLVAKLLFDSGDTAGATAQLNFVLDRSGEDELKQIARVRLASNPVRRQAVRRRAAHARRQARRAVRGRLRGSARRHPRGGRPGERGAHRLPDRAHEARLRRAPYYGFVQAKLDAIGGPLAPAAGNVVPNAPRSTRLRPLPAPRRLPRRPRHRAGEMTSARSGLRRGLAARGDRRSHARVRRLCVAAVVDPVDSRAIVRLAHVDVRRRQEAGTRCPTSRRPRTRRSCGRSRSARRRPASRRPSRRTRSTLRRAAGTIVRVDPASGAVVWRIEAGAQARGRRRRGHDARRRRYRQGRRLRVRHRRQGAVAGQGVERGPRAAAGRRRHRRRVDRRRPHSRAHGRRRQDQMGLPADESAAHDPQLCRRHDRAAADCSRAPRAASCSRSISRPATSAGRATSPRPRARPSSSASPT